jgi:hypothetical protein
MHRPSVCRALAHTFAAALAALGLSFAPVAQAWTPAQALSIGGEGWEASTDVDASGRSVAVWLERTVDTLITDHVWTADGALDGSWTPGALLSRKSPSLGTTYVFPKVRVADNGAATAVWFDSGGAWAADRATGGAWRKSYLLAPNIFSGIFVANRRGDAAFVYSTDTPRGSSSALYALLRPAGGRWRAAQTVASGTHVPLDSAASSESGELLIAWGTYDAVCTRHCSTSNHVLNASRLKAGRWIHTTGLAGPSDSGFGATAVLSESGAGGLLYRAPASSSVQSITQACAGCPWTASVTAVTSNFTVLPVGAFADASGTATMAYLDLGAGASGEVRTVTGQLALNSWAAPVTVSGADPSPNQVVFGSNALGAAVLSWVAGDSTHVTGQEVRASVRPGRDAAWETPQTLSAAGLALPSAESAAMGSNGHAVVVFSGYGPGLSGHTEYASRR